MCLRVRPTPDFTTQQASVPRLRQNTGLPLFHFNVFFFTSIESSAWRTVPRQPPFNDTEERVEKYVSRLRNSLGFYLFIARALLVCAKLRVFEKIRNICTSAKAKAVTPAIVMHWYAIRSGSLTSAPTFQSRSSFELFQTHAANFILRKLFHRFCGLGIST